MTVTRGSDNPKILQTSFKNGPLAFLPLSVLSCNCFGLYVWALLLLSLLYCRCFLSPQLFGEQRKQKKVNKGIHNTVSSALSLLASVLIRLLAVEVLRDFGVLSLLLWFLSD